MKKDILILGIESSCDETSAAVVKNGEVLSNIIATQEVHRSFGGVVPELASRAHMANIYPVVTKALEHAGIDKKTIDAVAYTRGPGLLGALLVGSSFAKSMALGLNIPLIDVNHLHAHIHALFIPVPGDLSYSPPSFPFICLTVSGGHTQLVLVKDLFSLTIIGETMDDAAGEAFDKIGKLLGLPYPAGPEIDQRASKGNANAFRFPIPLIPDFDFSFSGLKTSVLYFLKKELNKDSTFIEKNTDDLCASVQFTIVKILSEKLNAAALHHGIETIAIAGGVSANSELRNQLSKLADQQHWQIRMTPKIYCTDNAAMIAMSGYFRFKHQMFGTQLEGANARLQF